MRQHLIRKYEALCAYFHRRGVYVPLKVSIDEQLDCIWIGG